MQIENDLSICTIVSGKYGPVERMLRSIRANTDFVALECIVANIAGPSPEANAFAARFSEGIFFDLPGVAPVAAKNHMLRIASGRYIGLFDDDVVVTENCLKTLVDFMDDHPDVGVAGPRIVNAYGTLERTGRSFLSVPAALALGIGHDILPDFLWKANYFRKEWHHHATSEVDWLCGGAHILRRELIDEVGLLAEALPSYYEQEYYLRSRKSGWHNYFVHEAEVVHPNPARYGFTTDTLASKPSTFLEVVRFFTQKWFGTSLARSGHT